MRSVLVVLILGLFAPPSFADSKAKAAEHYKQGKAFEGAGSFDKAIVEYQAAYALDRLASHLFNIGAAYENKGDLKSSIDYFQRFLVAEPQGPRAVDARNHIAKSTRLLEEAHAKKRADAEAARIAAEAKKRRDQQDAAATQLAVLNHVKQAEAYAKVGAWSKAGDEHRTAAVVDGDPQHLLDAAAAFHKQPDDVKARDALLAYLAKVPVGPQSDQIRARVADLTRAIEKAESEVRRRDELAKAAIPGVVPAKPRRTSVGGELRGGIFATGSFVGGDAGVSDGAEVSHDTGAAAGVGVFVDFPLLAASHVHVGVRARFFKNGFDGAMCVGVPNCPSNVSAAHVGPAVTLEPSLYHQGQVDVYAVLGFSFGIPIGSGKISFVDGRPDEELDLVPQPEPELGIGVRFGPVSVGAAFSFSLSRFNGGAGGPDLGGTAGILLHGSWTLPR